MVITNQIKSKQNALNQSQLGLWTRSPFANVRPAALLITLTILCWSLSVSNLMGLVEMLVARLVEIFNGFSLALYIGRQTYEHTLGKKTFFELRGLKMDIFLLKPQNHYFLITTLGRYYSIA